MKNPYVQLAKMAVEKYVKEGKIINPPKDLPEDFFKQRCGVFVSIHKGKELRGCIGTYLPTKENLAKEIISNAISATKDPRFSPIQPEELPCLSYEVYLLEKPEPVKSIKELDPKKYGILVQSPPYKSGLLLPDLEGIDTPEKQILIACYKAGIDPQKEAFLIYRFKAKKYSS